MTAKEVAAYLRLSYDHFVKVTRYEAGFPRPFRIGGKEGGRLIFSRAEINAWLTTMREAA